MLSLSELKGKEAALKVSVISLLKRVETKTLLAKLVAKEKLSFTLTKPVKEALNSTIN